MSGRSGYRKTEIRVLNRRLTTDMPDWRLTFVVPEEYAFALSPGPVTAIVGASIAINNRITLAQVVGKNRPWVLAQADALADRLGYYKRPLLVHIARDILGHMDDRPIYRPFSRGDANVVEIGRSHITEGGAMRALA